MTKEIDLGLGILDHQLLDSEGRRCGNVDDLELEGVRDGAPRVVAILTGPPRGPDVGVGRLAARLASGTSVRIPWEEVEMIKSGVHLRKRAEELRLWGGYDRARRIVERIPGACLRGSGTSFGLSVRHGVGSASRPGAHLRRGLTGKSLRVTGVCARPAGATRAARYRVRAHSRLRASAHGTLTSSGPTGAVSSLREGARPKQRCRREGLARALAVPGCPPSCSLPIRLDHLGLVEGPCALIGRGGGSELQWFSRISARSRAPGPVLADDVGGDALFRRRALEEEREHVPHPSWRLYPPSMRRNTSDGRCAEPASCAASTTQAARNGW